MNEIRLALSDAVSSVYHFADMRRINGVNYVIASYSTSTPFIRRERGRFVSYYPAWRCRYLTEGERQKALFEGELPPCDGYLRRVHDDFSTVDFVKEVA